MPATNPNYRGAAKAYPLVNEDVKKPIILLMHGNSSTPADWEKFPADKADALPMLAARPPAQGLRALPVPPRSPKDDAPPADHTRPHPTAPRAMSHAPPPPPPPPHRRGRRRPPARRPGPVH